MHFKPFVEDLLKTNKIKISENANKNKIIKDLNCYIDALIFNIVSIGAIVSVINNCKSIKKENITIIKRYIEDKCQFKYAKTKKTGGTVLPSEYFGNDSGRYNQQNAGEDLLKVNWATEIARPQIGGAKTTKTLVKDYMNEILKYYDVKASNEMLNQMIKIFDFHIKCLLQQLKNCSE